MKNKRKINSKIGTCVAILAMTWPTTLADPQEDLQTDGAQVADKGKVNEVFDAPTADEIAAMITALGDESFTTRQQATTALWQLGAEVLPTLRKAATGPDPEASDRASELVLYITSGVLFDSPEEVKALVLKYSRGNLKTKVSILKKLKELGQWKQVLHLAQLEKDPTVREKLSETVKATASRAAQEAVVAGDLELAAEVLQLSGDDDQALVVRAWFYCSQGKFQEELKKAKTMQGEKGTLWRMALYRAHGDLDDSIREAKKANRSQLVAALQVLDGNPLPWLNFHTNQGQQDNILSHSSQIQIARLAGDKKKAVKLARDLARMAVDEDTAGRVISCLAANGFQNEAIASLEKFQVDFAFEYHDGTEFPARALAQFGIPEDAKPPYTQWVKKFTAQIIESQDKILYGRLLTLAGFLVRHGEGEHAMAVIEPMMTALKEDGSDEWFDLIAKMPAYQLGPQAIELIEQRGNDDGKADLAIVKYLGTGKTSKNLWKTLQKKNEKDLAKSLREFAWLSGLIADPEHQTAALHQSLLKEAATMPIKDQKELQEALFNFAIRRHEVGTASRMVDDLVEANNQWLTTKLFLDATFQRWEKVEPLYAAHEETNPGDYFNLVKWASVLRKLDHEEKSQDVMARALLLTIGNVSELNKIGLNLSNAGFVDDAISLWTKTAMMAQPGSTDYDVSLVYLANAGLGPGQKDPDKKQWQKAASIAEIYASFPMRSSKGNQGAVMYNLLSQFRNSVMLVLNSRFRADFYQGMFLLKTGRRKEALALLDSCQKLNPGSGSLADDFFPRLRDAGVDQQYRQWFETNYLHVAAACKAYPKSHNSHNTAAWLASRALLRLDDAMRHAKTATTLRPHQGAYLDTMAEVWFAKGHRKKAIEWSEKAIAASISHAQGAPHSEGQVLTNYIELNKQLEHFKNDPLPSAKR